MLFIKYNPFVQEDTLMFYILGSLKPELQIKVVKGELSAMHVSFFLERESKDCCYSL